MQAIITGIVIYLLVQLVIGYLQNVKNAGNATRQYRTPPIVNHPGSAFFEFKDDESDMAEEVTGVSVRSGRDFPETDFDVVQQSSSPAYHAASKKAVKKDRGNADSYPADNELAPIEFTGESIINGIIMSEVLGVPKGRRK